MKLRKGTLLFLLLTCLAYTTLAQTNYELQGSDVTIDENGIITACSYNFGANTEGTQLIIPKSVTKGTETITIKGIANNFPGIFQDKKLVSVKFAGDSEVTTIVEFAFQNNQITTLTLPEGLTTIEGSTFYQNNITTLTLPKGLTTIGYYAFSNNDITELTFPDDSQLKSIGDNAFQGNDGEDAGGNKITTLTLPPSLMVIGDSAFYNNSLTTVTFNDSNKSQIQNIGSDAFSGNTIKLNNNGITLPELAGGAVIYKDSEGKEYNPRGDTFTYFDRNLLVFYILTADDVTVDGGIITECLRCEDFDNKRILIPKQIGDITITGIGDEAFKEKNLIAVAFKTESQVVSIGNSAFGDNSITTLALPTTLTTIGDSAFYNNPSLESFILPSVTIEGFRTYWQDGNSRDLGTNLTILKADFTKSFERISIQQFSLTTLVEGQQGGTIAPSVVPNSVDPDNEMKGMYDIGIEVVLTATPDQGWRFDKWVIGTEERTDNPTSINLDGNKSATAHFVQLVTLTTAVAEQQGGTIAPLIDPNGKVYDIETEVSLTATPDQGWRFDKWVITGGGDNNDNPITVTVVDVDVTVDADKTATAHFVQLVTLTTAVAEQQGGTIAPLIDPNGKVYDINTKVELTATPNEGWRFDKWVIGSEERTDKTTTITLNQDKTVTAHFVQLVTLTVKVNNEEGGSIEPSDDHFVVDKADPPSTQVLTAKPADGWRFDKWVISDEEDKTDKTTTITLDSDKTATAHFVQLVTLTTAVAEQQGGTIAPLIDPNGKVYDINTKVELTATPDEGWRFDKWVISDEEDKTDETTTITLNQDKTATAHFVQLVTLTTAVAEQQGGTIAPLIDPNGKVYDINTKVELTATPDEGWRFDKWEISDEENKTDNPTTITLDKNKSVTAHFVEIVTLTVKVNNEDGGSIEPSDDRFVIDKADAPSTQALTAKPNEGWRFDKWVIGTDEITENPTTITLDQDKTATAHFVEIVTLTVKVNNEDGGSIEPSDDHFVIDKADAPSTQALTAKPNDGWRFDKWVIGSEDITDNPTTITLDKNKSVTAHFVEEEEAITSILTEVVNATPYPNPVTSQITLKAKDGDLIQLFSQKGKQQYSTQHTGNEVHTIDVSTLPVGVYLVRITDTEGNTTTKRIVKK